MKIKQFIEKAIEGGWKKNELLKHNQIGGGYVFKMPAIHAILLDPLAWQAVGKVSGWGTKCYECSGSKNHTSLWQENGSPCALHIQHSMIDELAEGKSIEQYLETL